ncbi:MAG: hypothetical protein EA404_12340 [Spirochaetaceae bacterium]|nr:MAG: hypothetical protein EA404_12340 [Spirochaetaceae bacterium]
MKRATLLAIAALLLIGAGGWARGTREAHDGISIVATTGHIGDAVARIAPQADLTVLMGPGSDPHTYFPSTREVQRIQRADLVLWSGLELEIQMTGALQDLGNKGFEVGKAIPEHMLLAWEGHHHDHDHDHGDNLAHDLAHACRHLGDEPVAVDAVISGTLPEIGGVHSRFQILLAAGTADKGRLVYEASRSADYLFVLDRDLRLEIFDSHGHQIADEMHGHGPVDGCPAGIKYYVFELSHADYTLAFSRGDGGTELNMVVERIDHDHDHDHGDHHAHDDDHDHGEYDPHIWHDLDIWTVAVEAIAERIGELDPANRDVYRRNAADYVAELRDLKAWATRRFDEVPPQQRVLVTSHDAFGYLARAYGWHARGILGISTEDEAGVRDIQELSRFVTERNVRAIFFETAVDQRASRALQEAVQARGGSVVISQDPLYSDALGENEPVDTFIGAYQHNVNTIVDAILGNR